MTDKMIKETEDYLLHEMNGAMFLYVIQHAWPAGEGEWVIQFNAPTGNEQLQKQFLAQLLRCLLTPPEQIQRNGAIRDAIEDTTTGPFDEGGGS